MCVCVRWDLKRQSTASCVTEHNYAKTLHEISVLFIKNGFGFCVSEDEIQRGRGFARANLPHSRPRPKHRFFFAERISTSALVATHFSALETETMREQMKAARSKFNRVGDPTKARNGVQPPIISQKV